MAVRTIENREESWNVDLDMNIDRRGTEEMEEETNRYMEQVEKKMGYHFLKLPGACGIHSKIYDGISLEEVKKLPLTPGGYWFSDIPVASYVYWCADAYGREDICDWVIDECAVTIDGLLDVKKENYAETFSCLLKDATNFLTFMELNIENLK